MTSTRGSPSPIPHPQTIRTTPQPQHDPNFPANLTPNLHPHPNPTYSSQTVQPSYQNQVPGNQFQLHPQKQQFSSNNNRQDHSHSQSQHVLPFGQGPGQNYPTGGGPQAGQGGAFGGMGGRSSPWANAPGASGGGGGGGGAGPLPPNDTRTQLYVGNLPFRVRWQDLKDLMRKCGTVLRADVALTPHDGRSRGFGVVLFARMEDAYAAVEKYNGFSWQTRTLDVRLDTQDPTGVLAIAEANRQAALQQQAQQHFQLASLQQHGVPWPTGLPLAMPVPIPPLLPHQLQPPFGIPSASSSPAPGVIPAHRAVSPLPPPPSGSDPGTSSPPVRPSVTQTPVVAAPLLETRSASSSSSAEGRSSAASTATTEPENVLASAAGASSRNSTPLSSEEGRRPPLGGGGASGGGEGGTTDGRSDQRTQGKTEWYPQQQQHQGPMMGMPMGMGMGMGGMGNLGMGMGSMGMGAMGMGGMGMGTGMGHGGGMGPGFNPGMNMGMAPGMGMGMGMGGMSGYQPFGGMQGNGQQQNLPAGLAPFFTSRPTASPVPPGYSNRHLFVGNLPFNCQWQELKDLMRSAGGAVLRADIAQGPDGRSRGFGSVLFSSPQDAERAVQLFNGYDYNGRALKVHFDKFSHSPSTQSSPSMYPMQPPQSSMQYVPQHPYDDGHRDSLMPVSFQQEDLRRSQDRHHQPTVSNGDGNADVNGSDNRPDGENRPSSPTHTSGHPSSLSSEGPDVAASKAASPPGRITMPPPYPFAGPLSPLQGRYMTPMTPSMPAFTLGAFPQTPPLYPQFFSPGLGPFSPPMGATHFGHGGGGHFMNAAPGAPIHHGDGDGMFGFGAYNPSDTRGPDSSEATPPANEHEPSYFPPVFPPSPPGPPVDASSPPSPPHSRSTTPLASKLDRLHLDPSEDSGATLQAGWGEAPESESAVVIQTPPAVRRRSFVSGAATGTTLAETGRASSSAAFEIRRRFEGDTERRASFDSGDARPRPPIFGTSIWATNGSAVE